MRPAPCLMLQGTGSGVGKSVLATALCRLFARAGYRVVPFKAQNMSLNAAVTGEGGEIGRAQAAQAEAAGIEPTVDMNPILLKPEGDERSQVVVHGRAQGSATFREYVRMRSLLLPVVEASLTRLRAGSDLVVIEGAGSPAEINLAAVELVNMTVARMADARVLLVGDIERGGVFAALLGTFLLLEPEDRARVAGFLVNKFRGDATLLAAGLDALSVRTGVRVLGVVPYIAERLVPEEDSLSSADGAAAFDRAWAGNDGAGHRPPIIVDVAVVQLPYIANFDDVEPLAAEPGVRVRLVRTAGELAGADLVVLPGSKTTMADLEWLRERGLAAAIAAGVAAGRPLLGICGGYQMLGRAIRDPWRVESAAVEMEGLGLLAVATTFAPDKRTVRVRARPRDAGPLFGGAAAEFAAYEIHAGRTEGAAGRAPFTVVSRGGTAVDEPDGARDATGRVVGTYLHGLFTSGALRGALLRNVAMIAGRMPHPDWGAQRVPAERYDRLADIVAAAVDVPAIAALAGLRYPRA